MSNLPVSSSTIKIASRHCASAAVRQMRRDPEDRTIYGPGVAAHVALEAMAREPRSPLAAARRAATSLMTGGRIYKGQPEPPYSPDAVMQGLRIATAWAEGVEHGIPRGTPEVGVACSRDWHLVPYEKDHYYGQVLDLVQTYADEDDEGFDVQVVRIVDYKSAWSTGAWELDTLQLRGAACLGALFAEQECADAVEVQIGALRQLRWIPEEPRRFYLDRPLDAETLGEWREEITLAVDALADLRDRDPESVASPGAGCAGCPYAAHCGARADAGLKLLDAETEAENARAYLAVSAELEIAEAALKAYAAAAGPITLDDERELGFTRQEEATPRKNAPEILARELGWSAAEETLAMNLRLTTAGVNNLFRALAKRESADPEALRVIKEQVLTTRTEKRWGVSRRADTDLPTATMKEDPK
jgi:hypothetical protein